LAGRPRRIPAKPGNDEIFGKLYAHGRKIWYVFDFDGRKFWRNEISTDVRFFWGQKLRRELTPSAKTQPRSPRLRVSTAEQSSQVHGHKL